MPSMSNTFALLYFLAASIVSSAGQQMDPAQMQQMIQQQMGGSPGSGAAPPNRIGEGHLRNARHRGAGIPHTYLCIICWGHGRYAGVRSCRLW